MSSQTTFDGKTKLYIIVLHFLWDLVGPVLASIPLQRFQKERVEVASFRQPFAVSFCQGQAPCDFDMFQPELDSCQRTWTVSQAMPRN